MGVKYADNKAVTIGTGNPILDELENAGLLPDSGCRAASCGVCACIVTKGSNFIKPMDPVEEDTVNHLDKKTHPVRLICRAHVVDLDAEIELIPYHQ